MAGGGGRRLAAAGSDPGRERENNEDRTLCDPERGIYAVVDGVGGESGGEVAAQTAVEILHARLSRRTAETGQLIREAIALANKKIYELAAGDPGLRGMACVLTVAVVDGDPSDPGNPRSGGQVTVGHVGDSRLYLLRPGEIRKVTRDHSPVGLREDAGELSELEAMQHPRRNEIFRDVGSAPHEPDEEGFVDLTSLPFPADGALLICSDGLSDLVPSQRILAVVEERADDPGAAVAALIAEANAAGGRDNVSLVLVEGERYAATLRAARGARGARGNPPKRPAPTRQAAPVPGAAAAPAAGASTPVPRGTGGRTAAVPGRDGRRDQTKRPFGFLRLLASRPGFLLYGAVLAALALTGFANPFLRLTGGGWGPGSGTVLRVGIGDGGFSTVGEALARARSGDVIEVAPGEYRESLRLKAGVLLRSRTPRAAVLRPPLGSVEPVVSAEEVSGARLEGFRIAGDARQPLVVGLRLLAARVAVEGVEISGATRAGVEIAGDDRSELRYCFLHDNPGGGIVAGGGGTDLRHNLILRNGRGASGARPGVEVREGALPQLVDNRIEANGGGGVALPGPERADEVFAWNLFVPAARADAVRLPTGAAPGAGASPGPHTQP
jgi:serine/threonine protein phosphatase PrpC